MERVLLTGMSGTGESTAIRRLAALGYKTVDLDDGGWTKQKPCRAGEETVWLGDRVASLLSTEGADVLFINGAARNQTKFYPQTDPADLARVLALKKTVEPALERAADLVIDTAVPIDEVVQRILDVVLR